jgi:hypothetical protein
MIVLAFDRDRTLKRIREKAELHDKDLDKIKKKVCPRCNFVVPRYKVNCPHCGYYPPIIGGFMSAEEFAALDWPIRKARIE